MVTTDIKIDSDYLRRTFVELVGINSINPTLVAGAPGEAAIASYVGQSLRGMGLDVTTHQSIPGRISVVGRLHGSRDDYSLMFNGHCDTVGIDGMSDPFAAVLKEEKIYGRGAYDMKGGLAAFMATAKAIVDADIKLNCDLLLAVVADEEYASIGTTEILQHYRPKAAIVTEPTELRICLAHRGFVWLEVETTGRAAHGSRYDIGIDANMRMGRFLGELDQLEHELRGRYGNDLVGPPSLHAPLVQGGSGLSTYAASCKLQIERRTVPGEDEAQVTLEIQRIIDKLARCDPTFRSSVKPLFTRHPFETSTESRIVKAIQSSAESVLGRSLAYGAHRAWTDAALLSAAGVETVLVGPAGGGAHAAEEWIDLKSVVTLADLLAHVAVDYCQYDGDFAMRPD